MSKFKVMNPTPQDESSSDQISQSHVLRDACCCGIDQCLELIETLPPAVYLQSGPANSSIGVHVRHIIERILCVLDGLESGHVDYDRRARDRELEHCPDSAIRVLQSLRLRLESLPESMDLPLQVVESVHQQREAVTVASSLNREMMSLVSHTIHHLALVALLARSLGIALDADVGKAPSTLIFEREARGC